MNRLLLFTLLSCPLVPLLHAEDPVSGTEVEQMFASFGKLQTVAGNVVNTVHRGHKWRPTMEDGNGPAASLSRPHMAMADAAGNIYIADKESHAIRKVDLEGKITTVAGLNVGVNAMGQSLANGDGPDSGIANTIRLSEPNGLYTFPNGTTYVLDTGNGKVRKLTTDGMMITLFDDTSGMGAGRGLWVSPDESEIYYCASGVVKRWTPAGGIQIWATGFADLSNIDVDPTDGSLVVTDRVLHRVYRIVESGTPPYTGTTNPIAGSGFTGQGVSGTTVLNCALEKVRGVAFRSDGTYFLASQESNRIWFVDSTDTIHLVIDGDEDRNTHSGDGQALGALPAEKISEPRAVTVAPNGDLIVTENDRGVVRRVTNICIPLQISDVRRGSTNTIEFQSHREGRYRVDFSNKLGPWTPLMTVDGSGGAFTTVNDTTEGSMARKRFYRVVELPN